MTPQQMSVDLISKCEGYQSVAYLDTKGIPTYGFGTIRLPDGTPVKLGDKCTLEEAKVYLNSHLSNYIYPTVNNLRRQYNFSDQVYAALSSLGYNIGSALGGTSILAALKSGNIGQLSAAFRLYNKQRINGNLEFCQGLDNRRVIEIQYFNPSYKGV